MSELEEVKRKIASVEARLERAKEQGLPIDNPGVVALRNELTALYGEKASLRSSTSVKMARFQVDCSVDTIQHLCIPYHESVLNNIILLKEALISTLLMKIPVDGIIEPGSGLSVTDVFLKDNDGREAVYLVTRFRAFEGRCGELRTGMSEENVLTCITEVTGLMWRHMARAVLLKPVFSYHLNKKDMSGATGGDGRPDETDYLNSFMVCKSEHKAENLQDAINDLTNKLTGYNHIEYGTRIIFLPVIAAAGTYVEFAVIDVRTKVYHDVIRFDLSDTISRVNCFVMTINFFRLIQTMAPFIPTNPTPLFIKGIKNVEFNLNYVKKMISQTHTCPNELYELLGIGSVPCAVKVEKKSNYLKITPVGVRTPDNANDLSLQEVKSAIKSVLTCLNYLHLNGFVHRDIRWANLIRQYSCHEDGSVESCRFLMIDFEFAERDGEDMLIHNYMFAHVVPYGQPYQSRHDLILVGKLVKVWANYNSKQLEADANDFISMLNQHDSNASNALTHIWLQD